MNCKLCADIIISMLLLLLDVTINTNISFIVWTWEKMAEHNFMMWTLNSLLFLFIFFLFWREICQTGFHWNLAQRLCDLHW